jgi:hypothetical protein
MSAEAPSLPNAPEYKHSEMPSGARVPKEMARFLCERFDYRNMALEDENVVLEPLQEGVAHYPPVKIRSQMTLDDINRLIP